MIASALNQCLSCESRDVPLQLAQLNTEVALGHLLPGLDMMRQEALAMMLKEHPAMMQLEVMAMMLLEVLVMMQLEALVMKLCLEELLGLKRKSHPEMLFPMDRRRPPLMLEEMQFPMECHRPPLVLEEEMQFPMDHRRPPLLILEEDMKSHREVQVLLVEVLKLFAFANLNHIE